MEKNIKILKFSENKTHRSQYEFTCLISKQIIMIQAYDTTNIFGNDFNLVLGDNSFRALKINGTLDFSSASTLENNVFEMSKIDTLKLPNIKVVGESSFRFLETKTELDLSSLTAVPKDCFESSKPKKLTIGILKSISDSSFRWFSPQIESTIVLSESITTIPRQCFERASNIKLIFLGNINEIVPSAFINFQGQIFTFNRDIFINAGVRSDQVNDIKDAFVHDDILFTKNYLELENLGIPTNIMVNVNDPANIFSRLKDKPVGVLHHIEDKYNVTLLPNNFYNKIETVEIIKDKYLPILQKEYLFEMTLQDLVSLKYRILKQYKNDIMKIDSDLLVGKTIVINDQGDTINRQMLNKIKGLFDSANNHENMSNEVKSTKLKNK